MRCRTIGLAAVAALLLAACGDDSDSSGGTTTNPAGDTSDGTGQEQPTPGNGNPGSDDAAPSGDPETFCMEINPYDWPSNANLTPPAEIADDFHVALDEGDRDAINAVGEWAARNCENTPYDVPLVLDD